MFLNRIDDAIDFHVARIRVPLYEEFTKRTADYIVTQCDAGILPKTFENPVVRAQIFFNLIDEQYTGKLRETVVSIVELFSRHGLDYRLYDIHQTFHSPHRMTLVWHANRLEYSFDYMWDSDQVDPFKSFYRTGLVDRCGDVSEGDILGLPKVTLQYFEDNKDLPKWFVEGLKRNS